MAWLHSRRLFCRKGLPRWLRRCLCCRLRLLPRLWRRWRQLLCCRRRLAATARRLLHRRPRLCLPQRHQRTRQRLQQVRLSQAELLGQAGGSHPLQRAVRPPRQQLRNRKPKHLCLEKGRGDKGRQEGRLKKAENQRQAASHICASM